MLQKINHLKKLIQKDRIVKERLLALAYTVGPTRVQVTATLGTDYGLVETTFRESWEAEAEWEVASAYGAQNVNGNSNQLQVTDRVV